MRGDYNRGGVVEKRQLGWQFVGAAPRLAVIPCWSRESERTPMKSFLFSRMCMSVLVATITTACGSRAVAASQAGAASAAGSSGRETPVTVRRVNSTMRVIRLTSVEAVNENVP